MPSRQRSRAAAYSTAKLRLRTSASIDNHVIVITHRARQHDVDLAAQRGVDQAVQEAIVGRLVRAQQELALRAATRDQVELTRKDLAWKHPSPGIKMLANLVAMDLIWLAEIAVRPRTASEIR
jgi:hypothetical protein